MQSAGALARWRRALSRLLTVVTRPIRQAQGKEGIVLEPYRGYGSRTEVFVIGRVFRQSRSTRSIRDDGFLSQLRDIGRRLSRRTIAGAVVSARFYDTEERVTTDGDGYFRVHLRPRSEPPAQDLWHTIDLVLEHPQRVEARGQVFIPPEGSRYVVISDIDDTIMHTGVANKIGMLWRLFVEDAESRVAFPGVAALYKALHTGASGREANPILYVSRAPWGLYNILDEFFDLHGIPVGPMLFLREWGVSWKSPLPRKAEDHKQDLIRNMLGLYSDLPFILIGDSGQHDPEVYRQIVEEHPGRVLAVYIRNVSRDERRIEEIEGLAAAVATAGSSLVLAADSLAMAEHAADLGLIPPQAVADVMSEKSAQAEPSTASGTREITRATPDETAAAVAEGELQDVLRSKPEGPPPNVVVEPAKRDPAQI
ncbi:MAG TPA: phosphatase domain-containing protein [Microvirga sp.]|jgi:phosphatidate phosphatase APP1